MVSHASLCGVDVGCVTYGRGAWVHVGCAWQDGHGVGVSHAEGTGPLTQDG